MIIRNRKELEEAYQTDVFDRFFITPEARRIIKENLHRNLELLVDSYGDEGAGGYIKIIPNSISTEEGQNEYLAELAKWNLQPDSISLEPFEQKFDDIVAGWRLSVSVLIPFRKNVCEIPLSDVAPVPLPPVADFTVYINGHNVTITNKSMFYDEINWVYDGANVQSLDGDGNLFLLTYPNAGTYTITLTAKNEGFPDSVATKTITII